MLEALYAGPVDRARLGVLLSNSDPKLTASDRPRPVALESQRRGQLVIVSPDRFTDTSTAVIAAVGRPFAGRLA